MNTYLICLDMDGTILNHEGKLSPLTIQTISHLKSLGHTIVIATGRPFGGAIQTYTELQLDTPLITDNGGSVENPTDASFPKQKTFIPISIMHELFVYAKPFIISSFYTEDDVVYAYQYDSRMEKYFSGLNNGIILDKDMTEFHVPPTGLIYLVKSENQKDLETYIDTHFSHVLSYRLWGVSNGEAMYEIYLKHVSKATAIHYVLDVLGLDKTRWMSFGDGINDIEMIFESPWGVAMKNAVPELLDQCKDMTEYPNHEDGVAKYLIKRFDLKI